MLWLKIACVVVFVVFMAGLHFATKGFLTFMGPDFTYGALFGGAVVLFGVWLYREPLSGDERQ